jgi:hypothetical protein
VFPRPGEGLVQAAQVVGDGGLLALVGQCLLGGADEAVPAHAAVGAVGEEPAALLLGDGLVDAEGGPRLDLARSERGLRVDRQQVLHLHVVVAQPRLLKRVREQVLGDGPLRRGDDDLLALEVLHALHRRVVTDHDPGVRAVVVQRTHPLDRHAPRRLPLAW